jgi:hypothetical protein
MCAMRKTEASGWIVRNSTRMPTRALRLAVVALGVGLVMATDIARAQDEDDADDRTFEEKIIEGVMRGVGGTNMNNQGIDYRERSPLVVPPKLDLPPPAAAAAGVKAPNWPKDPDEARRKAAIAARKASTTKNAQEYNRPLLPSELNVVKGAPQTRTDGDTAQPGNPNNPILSPSQLGFEGKFSSYFGSNSAETKEFKGEPTRESLTQPPAGYQTPSPNFAYGTGPAAPKKTYDPVAGKYGD